MTRLSHRTERALFFFVSAILFVALCLGARCAMIIVPEEVLPGDQFILRLEIDPPAEVLGASIYFHASAPVAILASKRPFEENLVEDDRITSITTTRSVDMGGLFEPPRAAPFAITLTIEAPLSEGTYVFYVDSQSILLLADFSTVPITGEAASLNVVPELPPAALLGLAAFVRYRQRPCKR